MPDMKYGDPNIARQYSKVRDYVDVNFSAVKEMHRQVGGLQLDKHGVAIRGLLVRHLVLPGHLSGTKKVIAFLANKISRQTYLNLMDQYHPCYRADDHLPLDRSLHSEEYREALQLADKFGLTRLDQRHYSRWIYSFPIDVVK